MSVSFSNLLTPTNLPFNDRILQDASLLATIAMPAGSALVSTTNINLTEVVPFPVTETINVLVGYGASANGNANATNGVVYLQHAEAASGVANASNWLNIPTLGTQPLVAAATIAAATYTFKLPPGCKQFIRASARWGDASNLADANLTVQLLF